MLRHIVVFIYIFGSFSGMTGIFLYWLMSKKEALKDEGQRIRLHRFMISTFLIGLISFFTFYSQYIMILLPSHTAFRILDYLFWACFIFYWIDYLDAMVDKPLLRKFKKAVKWGCLGFIIIWIFSTSHIWDVDFVIMNLSSRILFVLLDILFCLLSLLVVIIYVIQGQTQVKSRLSGIYIFAVSAALMVYAGWQFLHYIQLFAGLSTLKAWELDPFNATAFFLCFTNLFTLIYVYYNDFRSGFLLDNAGSRSNFAESDFVRSEQPAAPVRTITPGDVAAEHHLTPREAEVMGFVFKGFNNAEIADELYISQNTVKHHIYNLFRKLHVSSRVELICLLQEYYS